MLKSELTRRERDVLGELCNGSTYKETATRLSMSVNTVRTHVKRIYGKMGVRSRTEAVVRWLRSNGGVKRTKRAR